MWFSPQLGSASMYCPSRLYSGAHPHTVGKIISTPRPCQGSAAFVIDGIPFSLFLLFSTVATHTFAQRKPTLALCLGAGPRVSVKSTFHLHCLLIYLRILFCCLMVWMEIGAHHWEHKVTENISTKCPVFLPLPVCTHSHTQACTGTATLFYSFSLEAINRHTPECPDLWYDKIDTMAFMMQNISPLNLDLESSVCHDGESGEPIRFWLRSQSADIHREPL